MGCLRAGGADRRHANPAAIAAVSYGCRRYEIPPIRLGSTPSVYVSGKRAVVSSLWMSFSEESREDGHAAKRKDLDADIEQSILDGRSIEWRSA